MTRFNVSASSSGKDYSLDFEIANDITQDDWDQFSKLIKLALVQLATVKK